MFPVRLEPTSSDSQRQKSDRTFSCRLLSCKCSFCHRVATKERRKSKLSNVHRNKICERYFLYRSLEFCKSCHKCPNCYYCSTCRGKVIRIWGEVGSSGFESQSSPQPIKTGPPFRDTVSAGEQKCKRTDNKPKLTRVFWSQTKQILDRSKLNTFQNTESFKMETPETIRTSLQTGEWVTSIDFRGAYFHIPIHSQSRKYMRFHLQSQSYQFKALPFGLSTAPMEITVVAKEITLMALQRGIRIHQYLDVWLVRVTSHKTCLQHTRTLVALCQELGWLVNKEKSELVPKQIFNFIGYQFRFERGQDQTHTRTLAGIGRQDSVNTVWSGVSSLAVHVPHRSTHSNRKTSSPRATPRQPHTVALEKQLEGPRITRKGDASPKIAPSTPKVVAGGNQCASRSTITPTKTCSENIYRCIKRRVEHTHLNERTARGTWSLSESKLHINHLELKAVFLALKEFQVLCCNNIALVVTDNTTVVAYINKKWGMKSGSLCALLWRILSWCTRKQVTLKEHHIPD